MARWQGETSLGGELASWHVGMGRGDILKRLVRAGDWLRLLNIPMRNLSLVLFVGLLVGCTAALEVGDKIERAVTPPDAVNFYTTQADGSFKSVINDSRIARKVE
ncbi:MAG: hypothetical protein EBY22_14485, partial [Gammaproteobacteria bacterium]|nr:hypothetical protein [Gammaproteobacteria bacterium]